jgi:hypothetical protein
MYIVMAFIGSFCIAASVILGVTLHPRKPVSAAVVTETEPLFYTNGNINQTLVQQLAALVNATPRTNINVGAAVNTPTSNAGAIRTANGGAVPNVKLFQSLGVDESTSGANPNRFSNLGWRLMFITDVAGGRTVLTFWAKDGYRSSCFNGVEYTATNRLQKIDYNIAAPTAITKTNAAYLKFDVMSSGGCEARNVIMDNFCSFLSANYSSVAPCIVTPRTVGWQTTQPIMGVEDSTVDSLTGARLDDLIWLPSSYELGDGGNNFWETDNSELGFVGKYGSGKGGPWSWLRSSSYNVNYSHVRCVSVLGAFVDAAVTNNGVIELRPALHLSLSQLNRKESSIVAGFAPGSTTGNGASITQNS